MKNLYLCIVLCIISLSTFGQETTDQITKEQEEAYFKAVDSINKTFKYEYGKVSLENGLAEIEIPQGYKFLNSEQSKYVLSELWGNPPSEVLGMLFPEKISPIDDNFTYAVEITYSNDGYIDDEDAKDLDYEDLLEEMQDDTNSANPERKKLGYPEIELLGWASEPFYDDKEKKLHWAKELKFEGDDVNTLNYNIRVLGRKGYLNLNAIGTIDVLPLFKNDVNKIINSVHFTEGNRYSDFNPDIDKVAAYGIGGLIAGKLLAKAGFFALLLKFWKFIAIGAVGLFSVFKKKIFGSKENNE